ncbi:PREDICTED: putative F-box protein At1g46984 [Camelina sativa]|uniref:F-box protein At1g46984 n=1 Tax=Camelina sativa TaxID=90675 RepID=A0ABM0Y4P9_CAMSA|nr:PREDICTED: putative F-box protein At1g46984 [Camelina sativa]
MIAKLMSWEITGKQALICRCVSKTFLSVIDSRCFMERHLHDDDDHHDGGEPPELLTCGNHGEFLYKMWMCKTRLVEESDEANVLKVDDRHLWNYPCKQIQSYFHPISSKGLILTRSDSGRPYVFNPIPKEAMKIPEQMDENSWKQPLGFGYDPKGNTHKIISVWETEEHELVTEIFNLRGTDSKWRSLDISSSASALPSGHVSFSSSTVTIRGYLLDGQSATISDRTLVQLFRLTNLRGTLAMVDFFSEECVGLWTLRDKAREEWSLDYRFDANVFRDKVRHFCRGYEKSTSKLHVVGAWKEGLLLRIWGSTVCIYLNLKTKGMEFIGFENEIQELITRDFIVSYNPNYLLRLKTYYDQSRVICAHPHVGARIRGRLHVMLTPGDSLAYELRYFYDSFYVTFDELIGFRSYKENRLQKDIQLEKARKSKEETPWTFV